MKLIKKIAAIMFAFMMVFSLSTNAKAESGSKTDNTKGTITISNAIKGQDYKIYKILELESFNADSGKEAYSYKIATGWNEFFTNNGEGSKYVDVKNDYVTWKNDVSLEEVAELAKKALVYAKGHSDKVTAVDKEPTSVDIDTETEKLTYSNLDLGYYLVESSVGALCGLDTTKSTVEIEEKNSQPTLEKNIINYTTGERVKLITANVGEKIHYQVDITVGKGAKSYVFHDEIESGLEYEKTNQKLALDITTDCYTTGPNNRPQMVKPTDSEYSLTLSENNFILTFEDSFIQKLSEGKKISLSYNAYVTSNAPMDTAIKNTAYLNYGNNQKTAVDKTSVFTYKVPVWKYTNKGDNTQVGLPGATFKLFKDEECTKIVPLKQENTTNEYIYTTGNEQYGLTSDANGNLVIKGLAAGQYYLKEIKAPNAYNILTKPIHISIYHSDGIKEMQVEGTTGNVEKVDVLNNKGSILPSTGGMGTTLIYLIGGALVLGSGFVLANKKRAKAK